MDVVPGDTGNAQTSSILDFSPAGSGGAQGELNDAGDDSSGYLSS